MYPYMTDGGIVPSGALYYDFDHAAKLILRRKPQDIAETADVEFHEKNSCFSFPSLGQQIKVTYPGCRVTFAETGKAPVINWRMPILYYLSTADGFPLSGNLVPFDCTGAHTAHPENFEKETGIRLLQYFDDKPPDHLKQACAALGGQKLTGSGDLYFRFDFMPRFSIFFKFWYSDDETPGSGKFLFDEKCIHYVEEMDIQMCGPLLAEFLIHQYEYSEQQ